jgi:hypothetical protein
MKALKIMSAALVMGALVTSGLLGGGGLALAGGEGGRSDVFVGRMVPRATTACETYDFHLMLAQNENGGSDRDFSGYVFSTSSKDVMSSVSGKLGKDGKAKLTLTPMHGKGPAGTAEGEMRNGALMINMFSETCPMTNVSLVSVPMVMGNGG